jgi:tetratricopeptide (TPR) repeat protein/ferredoxin
VLIAVHVLIALHVLHWVVTGMTVSPVEPSESMQTLEQGLVNAGAIFFLLAILSTLLFGRFFCGWGCHVVALQDLCSWILGKFGLRPKPFRSRLLIYIPLGLAIYMFFWPTLVRVAFVPAFEALGWDWPAYMTQTIQIDRLRSELLVEDFWATFPPWYVAIPFLFVCGFVIVYFLGSKGFCFYGCPYGGIFGPVDRAAPVRIRVTDACEHCGHCTATCTSNVRIHEEVRDYGMVVDPGCMKCMDCVSVCPNDALYVGLGRPALLAPKGTEAQQASRKQSKAKRGRRYDLTIPQEIAAALTWLWLFITLRGFLDQVPMLMAAGMAGIGTYLLWKAWLVLTNPNVRIHGFKLRARGRVTAAGLAVLAFCALLLATSAWSGAVRGVRFLAMADRAAIDTPADTLFRLEFEASKANKERAERAISRLLAAERPSEGGFGWGLPPDRLVDLAYLQAIGRDYEAAARTLERLVDVGNPTDGLIAQVGQLHGLTAVDPEYTIAFYERALDAHPDLHTIRGELARVYATRGEPDRVEATWTSAPDEPAATLAEADFLLWQGRPTEAAELIAEAGGEVVDDRHATVGELSQVARSAFAVTNQDLARGVAGALAEHHAREDEAAIVRTQILAQLGTPPAELIPLLESVTARTERARPGMLTQAGRLLALLGESEKGIAALDAAARRLADDPWSLAGLAGTYTELAGATGRPELAEEGLRLMQAAVALRPSSPVLHHDLASLHGRTQNLAAAAESLSRAVELSSENPVLPQRLGQVLGMQGDTAEAEAAVREAVARSAARSGP